MYVYTFENAVNGVITTDSFDNTLVHISSAQLAQLYCNAVATHLTQYKTDLCYNVDFCENILHANVLQHVYKHNNKVVAQHTVTTTNKLTQQQLQELTTTLTAYVSGMYDSFTSSETWRTDYLTQVTVQYCEKELRYKEMQETVEVYYGYEFDKQLVLELVAVQETENVENC